MLTLVKCNCLTDRTRLFVQYIISLSSLCKLIWRHWTYKIPVRYILSSVWVRLSIFSRLSIIQSIIQYVGLCVFSLPTPLVTIERIYILCLIIMIKSEVWTFTHCLGLGHETMACAVCLSTFLEYNENIWTWLNVVHKCGYSCEIHNVKFPAESTSNAKISLNAFWTNLWTAVNIYSDITTLVRSN